MCGLVKGISNLALRTKISYRVYIDIKLVGLKCNNLIKGLFKRY